MKDLWAKARALLEEFSDIGSTTYASSLSYFTFVSLVPLLAICISLLSAVGISEQEVITFLQTITPDVFESLVESLVMDAYERSGVALSISTLVLLWSASKGADALRVALNAAYKKTETRNEIVLSILSILTGLAIDVLLSVTIYLVFSGSVIRLLANIIPALQDRNALTFMLNSTVIMLLCAAVLVLCYTFLPVGKRKIANQLPGAVFAVLACGVLSFGFRIYVDNYSSYSSLYGSIATVALFLYWMYLLGHVLIMGGFINWFLEERREKASGE